MELSVLVVTWNAKKFVDENFGSILADLKGISSEVIAVDNASTDGTADMIASHFPEVKLTRSPKNLGFSRANIVAINQSTGKYVCLVNPDVRVLPGCFRALMEYLDKNPTVGVVGPKTYNPDGSLQRSCMRAPSVWISFCRALALDKTPLKRIPAFGGIGMEDFAHDKTRNVDVLNGAFTMIRRTSMDEVGLIDERFFMYGDDLDWFVRFNKGNWPVMFYPGGEIIHYGGGVTAKAPVYFYVEMHKANLQYFQKHHSWLAQRGFLAALLLHDIIRYVAFSALSLLGGKKKERFGWKAQRSMACMQWILRSKEPTLDAGPVRAASAS
jgi:GT2 family glycosyltransferase